MLEFCEKRGAGAAGGKPACASQFGFTLIEVMVVIIIVAILLAVAAPGYRELVGNNRIVSEVYALRATLSHARTEALARRATVVVCPTADGAACADSDDWSTGYLAFVDTDGDGAADPTDPDEEVIQRETDERSVDIEFDNAARMVRFGTDGIALGSEGIFTFCDDRGVKKARGLILDPVGSVRAATDTDTPEDFIVDDVDDSNVTCN